MMHTKQYALLTDAICTEQTSFMIYENISCSFILVIHKHKYSKELQSLVRKIISKYMKLIDNISIFHLNFLLLKGIYSNIYQIIGNRNFSLQLTKLLSAAVVRKGNINKQIDEKQLLYAVDFYFLLPFKFYFLL